MDDLLMLLFFAAADAIALWGTGATLTLIGMLPVSALVFYYRGHSKSTAKSSIRTLFLVASITLWLFLSAIVWITAMVLGMWG